MTAKEPFARVIRVNVALLIFCGVLPCDEDATSRGCSQNSQTVLGALAYGCLSMYSFLYAREFILHSVHLDTWTESLTMLLSLVSGQARFTFLLLLRDRVRRLLANCEKLWRTLSAAERKRVSDCLKATKRLTCSYVFVCAFTIFFYAVASLLVEREHPENVTATRTMPYEWPFKVQRSPYYEIMYAMQMLSMLNVGLTCVASDTIGPTLILTACGHFRVLSSRILSLGDRESGRSSEMSEDPRPVMTRAMRCAQEDASRDLAYIRDCVRYHQAVLEFYKEVESLTTGIFLTQLLSSTYNISLVGFKLAGDDSDKFKYTTQLSIAVIQLFLCNWPADELLDVSQSVAGAAYIAPWYRYPYRLKKSLSIVAIRSQKPAQLTAGHFVPLSLQTFASMVSSAASFFTMIRGMN